MIPYWLNEMNDRVKERLGTSTSTCATSKFQEYQEIGSDRTLTGEVKWKYLFIFHKLRKCKSYAENLAWDQE